MLPPDFKRRNPLRVRPFQDFDDAAPPPSNARNRLLNMVHETGGFNPTWRRKKGEEYIAPKEDDEQEPSKRKRKNKNKKTKEAKDPLLDKTTLDEGHDAHEFDPKMSIQGGFLIVVPIDLFSLWEKELQMHLENPPSVIVYHGHQSWYHSTAHTADELAAVDVVITSYETLRSDYEDAMAAAASHEDFFKTPVHARSPTMVIYWRGQILDEAHEIANDKTGVNKAVNRVRALMRLPLTGTPFLNDYTDIHSQLSLIKLAPCEDPEFFASHFLLRPGAKQCVYCMF
ncbi:hypothetical protein J4E90_007269 [Alternaria incomplexa]|uniref:uncharacterized protein n=1 Tax=Alternaria incomplexa TaxID=1187928 RepID=UPI00221F47FA|nr:uncharacterized protein J4E90_007269 [Alternaria incomplexa]KAI4911012.1 hypothetical protein J4E90_007269 [Alternaria incomplexa]